MQRWHGTICQVNTWTDDDRLIEVFEWRDTPMTMRAQFIDNGGHSNAVPTGTIEEVVIAGNDVNASGAFSGSNDGQKHWLAVEDKSLAGVSVDCASFEAEDIIIAGDGTQVPLEEWWMYPPGAEPWPEPFRFATIYHRYVMGAMTGVAIPAFAAARIEVDEAEQEQVQVEDAAPPAASDASPATAAAANRTPAHGDMSTHSMVLRDRRPATKEGGLANIGEARRRLLASSTYRPPASAFRQQELTEFTPWTIEEHDGVFVMAGHAYPWHGRHRGFRGGGTTVEPPKSRDFTQFLNGGWMTCDDGQRFQIGVVTHRGGHGATAAEYARIKEDPANQLGPCVLYADEFGVQVRGVCWPDIDEVSMARAVASYPSGDWQWHNGEQKLHGLALVNNPGFHSLEQDGVVPVRMVASMARVKEPKQATVAQQQAARRRHLSGAQMLALRDLDKLRRG